MKKYSLIFVLFLTATVGFSQSFKDKKLENFNGYFNFFYEEAEDKLYLKVEELNKEFLYWILLWVP